VVAFEAGEGRGVLACVGVEKVEVTHLPTESIRVRPRFLRSVSWLRKAAIYLVCLRSRSVP
jgi:hypothetical protein